MPWLRVRVTQLTEDEQPVATSIVCDQLGVGFSARCSKQSGARDGDVRAAREQPTQSTRVQGINGDAGIRIGTQFRNDQLVPAAPCIRESPPVSASGDSVWYKQRIVNGFDLDGRFARATLRVCSLRGQQKNYRREEQLQAVYHVQILARAITPVPDGGRSF